MKKDILTFTKSGILLGVGAGVVGTIPNGNVVTPAFSIAGSMMSPVGTVMMAGHTIKYLKKMKW